MSKSTGAYCAMALCKNSYKYRNNDPSNPISFHQFPKNPAIRKKWVSLCKRKEKFNVEIATICSEHFKPEDFMRDLQAELLGYTPKRRLHPGTVPSKKIPYDPDEPKSDSAVKRRERMEMKRKTLAHEEVIRAALETPAPSTTNEEIQEECLNFNVSVPDFRLLYEELYTQTSLLKQKLQVKTAKLEVQTKKLQASNALNRQLKKQTMLHENRSIKMNEKLNKFQSLLRECEKSKVEAKRAVKDAVKKVLEKRFTDNEIKILTEKQKHVHWTREEISKAITLHCLSRRAYVYVRKTLRFPLPAISSLQLWAKTMHQSNGLLADFRVDNPGLEQEDVSDSDTLSASSRSTSPASETNCSVEYTVEPLIFENGSGSEH